jgi:hypothetical protein
VQGMDQGEEPGEPRRAAHPKRELVSLLAGCLADTGGIMSWLNDDAAHNSAIVPQSSAKT